MSVQLTAGMWCLPNQVVHGKLIALSRMLGLYPMDGKELSGSECPYIFVYSSDGRLSVAESDVPVHRALCTEVSPLILTALMKAHANKGDDGE